MAEKRFAWKVLVGKPEEGSSLYKRPKRTSDANIKTDIHEMKVENEHSVSVAQKIVPRPTAGDILPLPNRVNNSATSSFSGSSAPCS
jgi:hypothetical protein